MPPKTEVEVTAQDMKPATDEEKIAMLQAYSTFVFDLDGTLWTGGTAIEGVQDVLDLLRYLNKKIYFVTNNSSKSRDGYVQKFKNLSIQARKNEIFGTSYVAAQYLKGKRFNKKVFCIGEEGMIDELKQAGFQTIGGPEFNDKAFDFSSEPTMEVDPEVGAVLVGLDRNINYYKLQYGLTCLLQNKDCMFIATNTDASLNLSSKQQWAGAGTMVGAMIGACEQEPVVVGKPSTFFMEQLHKASGVEYHNVCVVGDRLDTDITWGNSHGCGTLLVLSGVTSEETLKAPDNEIVPTLYVDSLADLLTVKDKMSSCVIS